MEVEVSQFFLLIVYFLQGEDQDLAVETRREKNWFKE